jgi:hypothetical protein
VREIGEKPRKHGVFRWEGGTQARAAVTSGRIRCIRCTTHAANAIHAIHATNLNGALLPELQAWLDQKASTFGRRPSQKSRATDLDNEIAELHGAGFTVKRGINNIRLGITAVRARLEDGRLRVVEGRCPNLLTEAGMYRWGESESGRAEVPVDQDNHALAALRYLVAAIDRNRLTTRRKIAPPPSKTPEERSAEERARREREMAESDDPRIWWGLG